MNEQRLRQARDTDDQAVAADEERQQHFVDRRLLTDDDLAQLRENPVAAGLHLLGEGDVVFLEVDDVCGRCLSMCVLLAVRQSIDEVIDTPNLYAWFERSTGA